MTKKNVITITVLLALICAVVYANKQECKKEIPKAVKSAIKALYPDAKVKNEEVKKKCLCLYELKLADKGGEKEVLMDKDGGVVTVETKEKADALPAAVEKAAAAKGKIIEAEKKVISSELKLVKLQSPETKYEVKVQKKDKTIELKMTDDGKILKEEDESKEKNEKKSDEKEKE